MMENTYSQAADTFAKAIQNHPTAQKLKLIAIHSLLTQRMRHSNEFQNEITDLFKIFYEKTDQIIAQVNSLVKGEVLPQVQGTPNLEIYFTPEEIQRAAEITLTSTPFECYWHTVLMNSKLAAAIHEEEEEILMELEDIRITTTITKAHKKFKLSLKFRDNEYFSNDLIHCSIKFDSDDNLLESKSTKIYWHPNKNIYNILTKVNKENGGFFKLFKRYDSNSQNDLLHKYFIDINFIANELIHEVVPHSFHYYLGLLRPKSNLLLNQSIKTDKSLNHADKIVEESQLQQPE